MTLIGVLSSGCKVSGSRVIIHRNVASPAVESTRNIAFQGATWRIICPTRGAVIGTIMNTIMMVDMDRAIASPS